MHAIEVYGGGYHNKGAQLMLIAATRRLRDAFPGVTVCVEPSHEHRYADRGKDGLFATFPAIPMNRPRLIPLALRAASSLSWMAPRSILNTYGAVQRGELDALVDISGYAFGDKWPAHFMDRFTARAATMKRRGRPVVMMPQMLGPFGTTAHADAFKRLAEQCDLIFARERISYEHAAGVIGETDKLRKSPDITIAIDPPPAPEDNEPFAVIVPNARILDKLSSWGDDYLGLLTSVAKRAIDKGLRVDVLLHATDKGDVGLGEQLAERLGTDRARVLPSGDPLSMKAHVGKAKFLFGSRFHGIVGGFSMGVPCVAVGWAHKYEMLAEDFGVPELIHRAEDGEAHALELVDRLLDEDSRSQIVDTIMVHKKKLRAEVEEAWSVALKLLAPGGRSKGV